MAYLAWFGTKSMWVRIPPILLYISSSIGVVYLAAFGMPSTLVRIQPIRHERPLLIHRVPYGEAPLHRIRLFSDRQTGKVTPL